MEFQTKIIEGNSNPKARIVWAGGGLVFLALILMCIDKYRQIGFWLFGVAVVMLLVGAFLAKGDVDLIDVSATDMVFNVKEVKIGETTFPLAQISAIVFQVEGYDGMLDPDGYVSRSRYSRNNGILNGMNNYLNFTFGNAKQEWQFYLPDPEHVQQLGALFEELYAKRIEFVERSATGKRTFLFAPVSERQWEDQMIGHGWR